MVAHGAPVDGQDADGKTPLLLLTERRGWPDDKVAPAYPSGQDGIPASYKAFLAAAFAKEGFRAVYEADLEAVEDEGKRLEAANQEAQAKEERAAQAKQKAREDEVARLRALARSGPLHVISRDLDEDAIGTPVARVKFYDA